MSVRTLGHGDAVTVDRGVPVVCLPWAGEEDARLATLESVVAHTDPGVPVLLVCPGTDQVEALAAAPPAIVSGRELFAVAAGAPGLATAVAVAAEVFAPGDVAVVAPGTRVGPGWLSSLHDAGHSDATVATATALGDYAGPTTVTAYPPRDESQSPGPEPALTSAGSDPERFDAAVAAVAAGSPRALPRVVAAGPHCAYLRRPALDLAGPLVAADDALAGFSERVLARGLVHVAADDVYVQCPAPPRTAAARPSGAALRDFDLRDAGGVLRRSLACARVALRGLSVTVDARSLGPAVGGTQAYVAELVLALARSGRVHVRAVVPPDLSPAAARAFGDVPGLELITYDQAVAGVERSDVVHRPQQAFTADDLSLLRLLGERIVIDHQDLIAYRNPSYHATAEDWAAYRRVSRLALAGADRAVFFSVHAMNDAVGEDLIPPGRALVAGIGADQLAAAEATPVAPQGMAPDCDFILCLGADYRHKNRPFAIALLRVLRRDHGFEGHLVLAGPHVAHGSSRDAERVLLGTDPDLAAHVTDLGTVTHAGRAWLFARARAIVFPSTYEGFGLLPLEAARAGVPCLFAPQAALVELAGAGAATLVPWDPTASAAAAAPLLADGEARTEHVRLLRSALGAHRWEDVVERLVGAYHDAVRSPRRPAAARVWQELERERYIAQLGEEAEIHRRSFEDLREEVGFARALAARDGLLTPDEQRGLMRIASRQGIRRLLLGPVGLLGRVGARRQTRC